MTPVERPTLSDTSPPSQSSSEIVPEHWNNVGDDLTENSNNTAASTWQEEAHWMSFRNAVQKFALLKTSTTASTIQEEDNEEDEESSAVSPKWNHVARQRSSSPVSSSSSSDSALASDLAETKMRLALAQAERDELEFVLFQQEQQKNGSTVISG
eukprot:CAMPEP_0119004990 /NCGR_PEP_ID=MMETSP1176-20130426/1465_1 /TAXON_ID=265551 /ORGANISM="Synedropsis recta cf, Strain CCMP1620" /LENGTH=154 /DNA_ID=CAMNT_0006956751 /DNA_START=22 /DNA_END=486 /DNA_ORIENTATION=+